MIDVCLLGCGGMMPLPERALSALFYRYKGKMILVDCGEGTQVSIKRTGWGFKSIEAICMTHYHADHVAGLPGLLLTMANSQRTEPVTLLGPVGIEDVIKGLTVIAPVLPFELILVELSDRNLSGYRIGDVIIKSVPADHNIPCLAYSLEIKRPGEFNAQRASELEIPLKLWRKLQKGDTVEHMGKAYKPEMVLGMPRKGIKVAYCTDTRPSERLVGLACDSDLFICEGFYGEDEKRNSAVEKKHMVFSEAAALAAKSRSKELWLTHYSPALKDPNIYMDDVKKIFINSFAGSDLKTKTLKFEDRADDN